MNKYALFFFILHNWKKKKFGGGGGGVFDTRCPLPQIKRKCFKYINKKKRNYITISTNDKESLSQNQNINLY